MALNAYLRLTGQRARIQGSVTLRGREGTSAVIAVSHEIVSPRDAASGRATGRRQHKPLVITKELDRASPALRQALALNEVLTQVDLLFYKIDPSGTESQYFTVKLTNAAITSVALQMPNNKHADLAALETFEDVGFIYQKIEWTWTETGTVAVDDWAVPVT